MAININNYNDVFGKLTKAVDIASASDNEEIKKIFSKIKEKVCDIKEGGDRLKRDNEILKIGVVGHVRQVSHHSSTRCCLKVRMFCQGHLRQ